ncbi:hypothetical protein [Cloacibacillus evryensis]|uniref:hypothetical protein n=1 Tax=Cloacibacillus evryensis TaxID=508460 RepID=UPI0004BC7F45|nr:hypothetical protein [Cloacibacillus evryensis]MEA5033995.1 hypothetical protein [Cloacibacillus evryensis]
MGELKIIPTKPWYKRWWGILLIVLCVFSAVGSLLPEPPKNEKANNNVPAPAPVQEKTAAEPEKAPAPSFDPSKHYTMLAVKNANMLNYSRRQVIITVPLGLTKEQLGQVLEHVAKKVKEEEKVDRVWVNAFHDKVENFNSLAAGTIDIGDKGNGNGEPDISDYYFVDVSKFIVGKMPEKKRKAFYSNSILAERIALKDPDFNADEQKAEFRKKNKLTEKEAGNIMMEGLLKGWPGPDAERFADMGYSIPRNEVGKEWYQCGTLHDKSSSDWLKASHQNRISTCADYIFKFYKDKKLNLNIPQTSNTPEVVAAIKPYAEQLAIAIDDFFLENKKEKYSVAETAVLMMNQAGWI